MKRMRGFVAGALLLGTGCATVTSHQEYSSYRSFRYEQNTERRIHLGAEYMERFPTGRFRDAVRADVERREEEFWEEKRSTLEGLQVYLRAFPAGAHVQEANARVQAYENERRSQDEARRAREQAERGRLEAERRAANERQRRFARDTMTYWLRALGNVEGWGETLRVVAEHNTDFNTAFGGAPEPVRRPGGRRKTYAIDFTVPVPGRTALSRRINMSLDLLMSRAPSAADRRLIQAQLVMHNRGLTGWFECETQGMCDPSDPEQRARSVSWSMDQLRGMVATAFPEARETPASLTGPEPEMEGELGSEDSAEEPAPAAAQSPIPPQPLGVQFSYVVGCGTLGGAQISAPEGSRPPGYVETAGPPLPVRACLRIDAWSAPDIQGVSTDEGLRVSFIPATALPQPGPARGRPGARPGPARPAGAARPAAGR